MKIKLFISILGVVIFFANTSVFGQKELLKQMLEDKTSFKEITDTYQEYFNIAPESEEKQKIEKRFARWAYYTSLHLGPEGEFVNVNQKTFQAVQERPAVPPGRSANGSWTFVGPNSVVLNNPDADLLGNGRADRIAFHPTNSSIFYVGTPSGGLWKTTNGGTAWTPLSSFIPSLGISGIVIDHSDPNTIYVLTGDGDTYGENYLVPLAGYHCLSVGVLVSHDGGENWEMTGELSSNEYAGYRLIQHPTNANILIAATSDGIYRTTNGGDSWTQEQTGRIFDVEFKPGDPSRVYASGVASFYYSTNTGDTWNSNATFNYPLCADGRVEIAVTPANATRVYLFAGPKISSAQFCGFYLSYNNGQDFYRVANSPNILGNETGGGYDQSLYDMGLDVKPSDDQVVMTGGLVIYKSTNSGSTFTNATTYRESGGNYIHPDIHAVKYNPLNDYLYVAGDGGLHRSADDGATWLDLYNGINTAQFYHFDDYDANQYAMLAGCQDNGVKYKTANTSQFSHILCCDGFDMVINYNDQTKGYAVINTSIFKYTNFTTTAPTEIAYSSFFPMIEMHSSNPDILYYSYSRIYEYVASTGTTTTLGGASIHGAWSLKTCPSNSTKIYAAGGTEYYSETGEMFISTNGGSTWSTISSNTGFPSTYPRISEIGVRPNSSQSVYACFSGYTAGLKVLYSFNNGTSWSNISYDLPNIPVWSIEVDASNNVYIGTDVGVYYKASGATNWEPFYNDLPSAPVSDLAINEGSDQLLAATFGRGIWKSTLRDACPTGVTISSNVSGPYFRSASNNISMSGEVVGGEGTYAVLRSGNYVDLMPGFQVNSDPGNKFRAYIGPCDSGIPPDNAGITPIYPDALREYIINFTRHEGTLEVPYTDSRKKELVLRLFQDGEVRIIMADAFGKYIQDIASFRGKKDTYTYDLDMSGRIVGTYYLYLVVDGQVDHLQEIELF